MSDFNYYDEIKSGNTANWINYLNANYIKTYAPPIKVFKLDKQATELDELYGEVKTSRIYLPPFEMRAFHLDNKWTQMVGEGTMPYLEPEEDLQFIVNFEDMVQKIRALKERHVTDIYIDYGGTGNPTALKENNNFIVKEDDIEVGNFDLTASAYNTTKKLSTAINGISNFSTSFEGNNDSSINIVSFRETRFKHSRLLVYSQDHTYDSITDIIEKGDVILSNKWKLYEVLSNMPGGNFGWDYATYVLVGNLRTLDEAELTQDYITQIKRHEYNLRQKIDME